MKVGPKALALLHHFESCRLKAYRCPAGVWTIGYGDTGPHVTPGLTWTQKQADEAFATRIAREFAPAVARAIGDAPTTPAQFGAMVALAYNIGAAAFTKSSVARLHKAGDHGGAARAFNMWTKADGRVLAGLVRRRGAEAALYRSDFAELSRLTQGAVK